MELPDLPLGFEYDEQNFLTYVDESYTTPTGDVLPIQKRIVSFITGQPAIDPRHGVRGLALQILDMTSGGLHGCFLPEKDIISQSAEVRSLLKSAGARFGMAGNKVLCTLLGAMAGLPDALAG